MCNQPPTYPEQRVRTTSRNRLANNMLFLDAATVEMLETVPFPAYSVIAGKSARSSASFLRATCFVSELPCDWLNPRCLSM